MDKDDVDYIEIPQGAVNAHKAFPDVNDVEGRKMKIRIFIVISYRWDWEKLIFYDLWKEHLKSYE